MRCAPTASLLALTAVLVVPGPAGASTVGETIRLGPAKPGLRQLLTGAGERHLVRRAPGVRIRAGRAARRRSLAYFAQLSDPHVLDEASPARMEFLVGAGRGAAHGYRPQEALTTQVLDAMVRAVNRHSTSGLRGRGGRRSKLDFTVTTGDLSDNAQANEARWYMRALEGGVLDPGSGQPISAANPCPGATPAEIAGLNQAALQRRYTGVQDHSDYPGAPAGAYVRFWDPNTGRGAGRYSGVRFPGLMDRAQQPFVTEGLRTRWYSVMGNHDQQRQGILSRPHRLLDRVSAGCRKTFPGVFDARRLAGQTAASIFKKIARPGTLDVLSRDRRLVPPDPDRRVLSKRELRDLHGGSDRSHGLGHVSAQQSRRSAGAASYYAWSPKPGMRYISLDTVAEGGGPRGNIDHPQYRWLARELDRNSSRSLPPGRGRARRDGDRDRMIVIFSHHPLRGLPGKVPDERAGPCSPTRPAQCDADPRRSTPLHSGLGGRQPLRSLLLRHPNVVGVVSGHEHRNHVEPFARSDGRGAFWQVVTASHIDFPQQSRLLELMDNRDGTLSLFGTVLNHAAGPQPPQPGTDAGAFDAPALASLSRVLSAPRTDRGVSRRGRRADRNVELVVRDPRRRL